MTTTPGFTLPTIALPGLYGPEIAQALAALCVPATQARPGEVVGVILPITTDSRGDTYPRPITHFLAKPAAPHDAPLQQVAFHDLPQHLHPTAALACMDIACKEVHLSMFYAAISDMSPWDGEDFHSALILTPACCVLFTQDYADNILEGRYHQEARTQAHIDACVRAITPVALASHHALIAAQPMLREALCIVQQALPILDDDGGPVTLDLPSLHHLRR